MTFQILFVDDDAQSLELFKLLVEPLGFSVATMSDSRRAAQSLESQKFDGIFVDLRMAHIDGFELTRRIRASRLNGRTPVIMLTGFDDSETRRRGFEAGVTFFFGKPFDRNRLSGLIRTASGSMWKEKCRSMRLSFDAPVTCKSSETNFQARAVDLGEEGMLIQSSNGLTVGDELVLDFVLPGYGPLSGLRACVKKKDPPDRVVLEFLSSPTAHHEALRNYTKSRIGIGA